MWASHVVFPAGVEAVTRAGIRLVLRAGGRRALRRLLGNVSKLPGRRPDRPTATD